MDGLKLYVWEGVLSDCTDGIIFALATSVDEARLLVMKKYDARDYELAKNRPPEIWEDMRKEPYVYDSPEGFYIWGGG